MKTATSATWLLAAFSLSLIGCESTPQVENSWTAPPIGSLNFAKIIVIAATPDGTLRRSAETAMKTAMPEGVEAVASFELIPDSGNLKNPVLVRHEVTNAKVDGIIVMRPLGEDTTINFIPSMAYPQSYWTFAEYYHPTWGLSAYYESEYTDADSVVGIETNIYNSNNGNLIWSGVTRIRGRSDVQELVKRNADAALNKMREQKLVP